MTVTLPDLPRRIAKLQKDERGFPVPVFVQWFRQDGKPAELPSEGDRPDFRYANSDFRVLAFKRGLCWICGEALGVHRIYAIGPMCVINRTTSEPASHRECAEFSAKACPFLIRPRMRRIGFDEDEPHVVSGHLIERNPGCVCLYETRKAKAFRPEGGGWLIRLGEPDRVDWWAEGRQATRAEILASMMSGYPLLAEEARKESAEALHALARMRDDALRFLPAEGSMTHG
jgi:hypothetical protein